MESRRLARCTVPIFVLLFTASALHSAKASDKTTITIGGVVYTNMRDPVRTGLADVTVKVQGDKGDYEAVTGGIIGLW